MEVRALSEFLDAVAAEGEVSDSVRKAAERAAEALAAMRERRAAENELLVILRERQQLLERLSRIQRKIVTRSALKEVLDAIVWGARELLGDEMVGLQLIDVADPSRTQVVASTGVPPEHLDEAGHGRVGEGAGGRAIVEERLVVIEGDQDSGSSKRKFVRDGVVTAMAAPVREHDNIVGSLVAATHGDGRRYTRADREVLMAFAEHASLALTDARTVQDARHNAFHDTLTELPNRELFCDRLAQALARAERANSPSAVIVCDLDGFKTVNDSLGHAVGDELLFSAARRFEACVRAGDTAARLGGDEFAVLLEGVDEEEVAVTARRILGAFAEPMTVNGREVYISCSIGIAFGLSGDDDVLRNADLALYRAKARGRGRFEVFRPEMHTTVLARMEMEADFQRALRRDEFELDYQPIFDLADRRMVAMEALVRWNHPERGRLSPDEFVPLAESGNLIHALGRTVLRKACIECAAVRLAERQPARLQVTVNISSAQLREPGLVSEVSATLDDSGLEPGALILELTETVFAEDINAVSGRLSELRELGVRIAVDDFGTGYSSLSHLSWLPIDFVKIARPFVVGIGSSDDDAAIARAIVYLAESFGLEVIAEGIENQAQVGRLLDLGCRRGQGFHLSLPLPFEAVTELVAGDVDQDSVAEAESAPL